MGALLSSFHSRGSYYTFEEEGGQLTRSRSRLQFEKIILVGARISSSFLGKSYVTKLYDQEQQALIIIKLAADGHRGFIILSLSLSLFLCIFKLVHNKSFKKIRKNYVTTSIGCIFLVQRLCIMDLSLHDPHEWSQGVHVFLNPQLIIGQQSQNRQGLCKGHEGWSESLAPGPFTSLSL